jgi:hypothetical protein
MDYRTEHEKAAFKNSKNPGAILDPKDLGNLNQIKTLDPTIIAFKRFWTGQIAPLLVLSFVSISTSYLTAFVDAHNTSTGRLPSVTTEQRSKTALENAIIMAKIDFAIILIVYIYYGYLAMEASQRISYFYLLIHLENRKPK